MKGKLRIDGVYIGEAEISISEGSPSEASLNDFIAVPDKIVIPTKITYIRPSFLYLTRLISGALARMGFLN